MSESSNIRRGKRSLHRGRQIWRDQPCPRCVSSPSTAISRPYCHHVRGVEDLTPVMREKRCIVSCRRSKSKRKTAWRMHWRATTGARWLCRRRWIHRNRGIGGRRWNRRNETNGGRQRRLRYLEWSRTLFISRWLGRRISSWLARKCYTNEKNRTRRQGREVQVPTCHSRVLAGGRCTLHGKLLALVSDRVNPDALGDGSGQGRRAAPFRRGAGIFEGGYRPRIYIEISEEFQEFPGAVGRLN